MEEINWYSKKIGKTVEEFDMFDKYITDVLKEFVKERKEAINYTRCSTQLKDGERMTFDEVKHLENKHNVLNKIANKQKNEVKLQLFENGKWIDVNL